eukprot:CAMPEP_0204534104 /NCGR_PEP_ID=MMETSP0661-20131031/12694_1 /ASSEMBLY_ACC=CAM_ASM_000606 /TAXON_ID=109239 /ORGANISM="Alexandrium margalefi, Strain AMGDE01CS-322" /LENGTH=83 /DNA_ID=CAMNT_0051540533 /DNA_START=85 /DNA_END=332 /DNA_ORIENTATION=-
MAAPSSARWDRSLERVSSVSSTSPSWSCAPAWGLHDLGAVAEAASSGGLADTSSQASAREALACSARSTGPGPSGPPSPPSRP